MPSLYFLALLFALPAAYSLPGGCNSKPDVLPLGFTNSTSPYANPCASSPGGGFALPQGQTMANPGAATLEGEILDGWERFTKEHRHSKLVEIEAHPQEGQWTVSVPADLTRIKLTFIQVRSTEGWVTESSVRPTWVYKNKAPGVWAKPERLQKSSLITPWFIPKEVLGPITGDATKCFEAVHQEYPELRDKYQLRAMKVTAKTQEDKQLLHKSDRVWMRYKFDPYYEIVVAAEDCVIYTGLNMSPTEWARTHTRGVERQAARRPTGI